MRAAGRSLMLLSLRQEEVKLAIANVPVSAARVQPSSKHFVSSGRLVRGFRAGMIALNAGWRAMIDYRRLSQLSDSELQARGLSRSDIPRVLHQRHFARLAAWPENPG